MTPKHAALIAAHGTTTPWDPDGNAQADIEDQRAMTASGAQAQGDELVAALRPFAADAQNWVDTVPDDYAPRCTEPGKEYAHPGSEASFTVGDIRRAAALIAARIGFVPWDPQGDASMDGVQEQFREPGHAVYVALPTTWEPARFFEAINKAARREVGDAVFFATPGEAERANCEAGADPANFRVARVTMTLKAEPLT